MYYINRLTAMVDQRMSSGSEHLTEGFRVPSGSSQQQTFVVESRKSIFKSKKFKGSKFANVNENGEMTGFILKSDFK